MRKGIQAACLLTLATMGLAGCLSNDDGQVSRFAAKEPGAVVDTAEPQNADGSFIIDGLQARRSVLPDGSTYDKVAQAVLAANSRASEAELRAARLRAEAASKNWLPSIGPNISLSSLGELVASLIIEQVVFDNGKKKAERAYAKADVEVAAVALAEDTNDRVHQALALYLSAEEGRDRARLAEAALKDMRQFEWVMNERVKGGISDMSDLNVIRGKITEMVSTRNAAREQTDTALAELSAMIAHPLDGLHGLSPVPHLSARSLAVVKAEATRNRTIAEAQMARAGNLPGVKATGSLGQDGEFKAGLGTSGLFGLGTGATLQALEAVKEAAELQVGEAMETAERKRRGKEQELKALERQAAEAVVMSSQAKQTLDLFQQQYQAGQRQVMDVVGVYETFASQQQKQASLKYKAEKLRLEIARDLGILADGDKI